MIVRMKKHITGTRNGEEWPQVGGTVDVPDAEARDLFVAGLAEEARGVDVADGFRPAGEQAALDEPVPEGSVKDVVKWVGDDANRAQRALDAELESAKPRKGVVTPLEDLIAEAEAEAEEAADDEAEAAASGDGEGADATGGSAAEAEDGGGAASPDGEQPAPGIA